MASAEMHRPSRSLAGKVAIVTGAGCEEGGLGNGRAISMLLAEDGAAVVCVDIDLTLAQRTAELVNQESSSKGKGGRAVAKHANVTDADDCMRVVQETVEELGRLDILINNVGIIGPGGTAVDTDLEEWTKGLGINVTSMMLMGKYAVPAMNKNERDGGGIRGSIVNMASVAGLLGGAGSLLYPTSKGAVVQMTRAMASHHGRDGIRVNTVCPGMIYTPMVYTGGMTAEQRESRRMRSLLQTEGNAWDCAASVRFLASGEARWITGTVLTVDAGASCSTAF